MSPLCSNRLAHPEEPVDRRQRLFCYGVEYADIVDLSSLGASCQGLFLEEREGHPARGSSRLLPGC